MRTIAGILALLSALTVMQSGQILRYKFAVGKVDHYRIDVRVKVDSAEQIPELSRQTLRGTGKNTYRVLKVDPNGTARVEAEVQPLVIRSSRPDPTLLPQKVILEMSPLGEAANAKHVRGKAVPQSALLVDPSALSRLGAVLPSRAVKAGDRWSTIAPNPFLSSGKITVTNRFFTADRLRGQETARIHQTMNIPLALRLSQSDGAVVRVHGALKVNTAIQFSPSAGKILRSSSLGAGTLRLTPLNDKIGEDSVKLTLNVEAISELE